MRARLRCLGRGREQPMSALSREWQPGDAAVSDRWDGDYDAERLVSEVGYEAVLGEAVERLGQR